MDRATFLALAEKLMAQSAPKEEKKIMWSRATIAEKLDLSNSTVERLTAKPGFPEPSRFGRSVRWEAEKVLEWARTRA